MTIGGEIQPSAVLDAASIGNVTENDRSDFVELPRSPTFNIGSLDEMETLNQTNNCLKRIPEIARLLGVKSLRLVDLDTGRSFRQFDF